MIKVVVEDKIPFVRGVLEPVAEVRYLPAEQINASAVRDADALVTRTRTVCDETLLSGSPVQFIATATIGTDHIDVPWCEANGIAVKNAPGCNAPAVAQYVMASILQFFPNPEGLTIGVVGAGHVGSITAQWAQSLGMQVMLCDPPRERAEGGGGWKTHEEILREADVITYHVPLIKIGKDATWHLFNEACIDLVGPSMPLIINAARGPVTSTEALVRLKSDGRTRGLAIDCWEGEPAVNLELLGNADIATPHIAGYSLEGKIRATAMAVDALCSHFGLILPDLPVTLPKGIPFPGPVPETVTAPSIRSSYDIAEDTRRFKLHPEKFENLRNNYEFRREPTLSELH